jgi:tetratricopeptide (TPR) repeat protein
MNPDFLRRLLRSAAIGLVVGIVLGLVFDNFREWVVFGTFAGAFFEIRRSRTIKRMALVGVGVVVLGMVLVSVLFFKSSGFRDRLFKSLADVSVPMVPNACYYDSLKPPVGQLGALHEPQDLGYPIETLERLSIRLWLTTRNYDALDTMLTAYSDSARRDFRMEYRMFDVYDAFRVSDSTLKPFLDEWVNDRPQSGNARLIRASYYVESMYADRGNAFVANTSDEQVAGMTRYKKLARADIDTGMALVPCNPVGYHLLMLIAPMTSNTIMSRMAMEEALKIQPYSFVLRARHMYNLMPRWGGTYEAMDSLADAADRFAKVNPRLTALHGFSAWDRGTIFERNKDSKNAVAQYDLALTHGDFWQFRFGRGSFYYLKNQLAEAADDLDHAMVQRPQNVQVLHYRAKVWYAVGLAAAGQDKPADFAEAFRLIDLASRIDPADENVKQTVAFYVKNIPNSAPVRP